MGRDSGYLLQLICFKVPMSPFKTSFVPKKMQTTQTWTNNLCRQFRHPYNSESWKNIFFGGMIFWWDPSPKPLNRMLGEVPWHSGIRVLGAFVADNFTAKLFLNLQVCLERYRFGSLHIWFVHKLSNVFIEDEGPGDHLKEKKDFVPTECGHRFISKFRFFGCIANICINGFLVGLK